MGAGRQFLARARPWADLAFLAVLMMVIAFLLRGLPLGIAGIGAVSGSTIALQALGLVLVYRATRIVNFAQLALGLAGAALFFQLVEHLQFVVLYHAACNTCVAGISAHVSTGFLQDHPRVLEAALRSHGQDGLIAANFWLSLALGFALGPWTGYGMHRLIARFWARAPRLVPMVAMLAQATGLALGASLLPNLRDLRQAGLNVWPYRIPFWPYDDSHGVVGNFNLPYADRSFTLPFDSSGAHFHSTDLAFVVIALASVVGLVALLRFTRLGMVLRGASDNPERASTLGIDVDRQVAWTWIIAGGLSAAAALLAVLGGSHTFAATPDWNTLTAALTVAVFARMTSLPRTAIAALALGVIDQGMFWNFGSHAPFLGLVLAILTVALLLQTRRLSRAELESSLSWLASPEVRPTPASLRRLPVVRNTITWLAALTLITLVALPFFLDPGQLTTASVILVYSIVGLSVFLLTGWAGQISLGQIAFAAIGGIVAAVAYHTYSVPMPLAALAGALAGAGVAVIVGIPALRLPGPYLAVVTLAFSTAVVNLLVSPQPPSLGQYLPQAIDRPLVLGLDLNDERVYYYFVLGAVALSVTAILGMRRSRTRRAVIAARDNEPAAQSFGINVVLSRIEVFAVSGFVAALGGVLLAFEQRGVKVAGFGTDISVQSFLTVVIGGVGSLAGPLAGAAYFGIFTILGNIWALAAIGGGALLVLVYAPGGLSSVAFKARDAMLRRIAVRNRIAAPSLLSDFSSTASGLVRAQIEPFRRRQGGELLVESKYRLRGTGPGPVAGTYLTVVGAPAETSSNGASGPDAGPGGPRPEALLSCRQMSARYDAVQALFDINIDINAGEIVALIGTNGAGKTTLLRAVAGLHHADKGAVLIDGKDVTRAHPHEIARMGVAMVPGGAGVFPKLSVAENLRLASWRSRNPAVEIETALANFPALRERLNAEGGNLSGGEQQQLALAQAVLVQPRLLLIDELSLGLSPQVVQVVLRILGQLRQNGCAIVIVEQSLNRSVTIADRAVVLEKGEVRHSGPARDLLDHPELFQSISFGSGGGAVLGGSEVRRRLKAVSDVRPTVLGVNAVRASYGGVLAVQGVDIELLAGEIVGIMGPNGAGKTTLFDVISGFHPASEGSIELVGADVTRLAPHARARLGLMRSFQSVRLFPSLTVRDNIAVALERHLQHKAAPLAALWLPPSRQAERKAQRRVDMLIELLGLKDQVDRTMAELSIGTRRLVDLACQLAARPRVLLLDEPSSGLAQTETEQLGPLISRIAKDLDAGVLIIEHDIALLAAVSDRLIAMDFGRVIASGASQEVLGDQNVRDSYFGGVGISTSSDIPVAQQA